MSAPPGMSSNPFEILGLDRSATFEDVKLAYRRLARQHHPDANPHDPMALERFTALRRGAPARAFPRAGPLQRSGARGGRSPAPHGPPPSSPVPAVRRPAPQQ